MAEVFTSPPTDARLQALLTQWEKCSTEDLKELKDLVNDEFERVKTYRKTLPKVARALANTITYMIMDDHEIIPTIGT